MNKIIEKEKVLIEDKIYNINGVEVMLDSDLADLYHVETKRINEAVKNNPDKFPKRYSWQLSIKETTNISRSKISTMKSKRGFNIKYGARVFTEQGVYMLATILKSKVATEVSIRIMDTFVKMRHYINYTYDLLPHKYLLLENKVNENTKRIDELFDKFDPKDILNSCVHFEGEYYDAYSTVMDIFSTAKDSLIIIDNYADKSVLDIIRTLEIPVTIITKPKSLLTKLDIEKYNKEYNNLKVVYNNNFHDRYFVLDNKILYHCGASLNKIGSKVFSINFINDSEMSKLLIDKITKLIA